MAHIANKTLLLLSILLISCQSPQKTIPDSAFVEVKIFLNKDTSDCSTVEAVTKTIPKMEKIEAQTLSELFKELSFPENTLRGFHIVDRKAYVDLVDISSIVPNSSCSSAALLAEMDATIKQFGSIDEILYATNGSSEDFYEWLQMQAPESFPDKF
ncbi:MAG: hypothetical protein AAB836_01490 [Patescibacteria group bacterium]